MTNRQRFDIELIHQNSLYQLELINGILDLTRIESGGLEMQRTQFNLSELIAEVLQVMASVAKLAGIELLNKLANRDIPFYADRNKMRQIIWNIISNAVKFTKDGDVEIFDKQTPDQITIVVRDSGLGIATSDLERIFEKFVQVGDPHDGRFIGTGIGLTISKSLAEMHGGEIWVESELGVGSTFYIRLPKTRPEDFQTPTNPS